VGPIAGAYPTLKCYEHADEDKAKGVRCLDEGRKRVLGVMASILVARHLDTADDLFRGPQGSPRTDKMVAAALRWAERIMRKIDGVHGSSSVR